MVLALAFVIGAVLGALRARRRGGAIADQVQYGLAHGFALTLLVAILALVAGLAGLTPG